MILRGEQEVGRFRSLREAYLGLSGLSPGLYTIRVHAGDETIDLQRYTWAVDPIFSIPSLKERADS